MATEADVIMRFDMRLGNMERATNTMVAQFRKAERAGAGAARSHTMFATSINKLYRSALYGVASYASVAGLNAVVKGMAGSIKEIADKRHEFEKAMQPLISLGDNAQNIGRARDEVLGIARAWGIAGKEVQDFLYTMESGTANLVTEERKALRKEILEFSSAMGTPVDVAGNLFVSTWQNVRDTIKDANALQNKFAFTLREAKLTPGAMQRVPELVAATKVAGMDFDEAMAALVGASKRAGNEEKLFTGLRTALLVMSDVDKQKKAGIKLTGDWVTKIGQLNAVLTKTPEKFRDMFDTEALVAASQVTGAVDDMIKSLTELKKFTDGADIDIAGDIILSRLDDQAQALTAKASLIKTALDTVHLDKDPGAMGKQSAWDIGKLEFQRTHADYLKWLSFTEGVVTSLDPNARASAERRMLDKIPQAERTVTTEHFREQAEAVLKRDEARRARSYDIPGMGGGGYTARAASSEAEGEMEFEHRTRMQRFWRWLDPAAHGITPASRGNVAAAGMIPAGAGLAIGSGAVQAVSKIKEWLYTQPEAEIVPPSFGMGGGGAPGRMGPQKAKPSGSSYYNAIQKWAAPRANLYARAARGQISRPGEDPHIYPSTMTYWDVQAMQGPRGSFNGEMWQQRERGSGGRISRYGEGYGGEAEGESGRGMARGPVADYGDWKGLKDSIRELNATMGKVVQQSNTKRGRVSAGAANNTEV